MGKSHTLLTALTAGLIAFITKFSYLAIIFLMTLESCNLPIPSELIMPTAGYLVFLGKININIAAFAGAFGCVLGSLLSYAIGYWGGRPFVNKYGKYLLIQEEDVVTGEKLFAKYGSLVALVSRLLPIVRTFISFPAGMLKMDIKKFIVYTFIGSLAWSYLLLFIGIKIGDNEKILSAYFHKFDILIIILIILAIALYIYRHVKRMYKK